MKRGLGKGLDALFADNSEEAGNGSVTVRLTEIEPNRAQPRKKFDEDALEQLSESIRNHGILQPLVVRPVPGAGGYQLVAGERRWRAARMAGLTEVPVVIRELSDNEAMEVALIENLQREDLNP
ncbi:MAG: ParB/RepB/Spo0J family partition protein, partial [Clostridia bacterium]|nr:ParB/RepB/Spo0J family partition protein [Clostridia bacterium]